MFSWEGGRKVRVLGDVMVEAEVGRKGQNEGRSQPLEAERGEETESPLELPEEMQSG